MEIVYRPAALTLRAIMAARGQHLVVEGAEHLPATGPVITAGNHISEIDPVVVGLALDGLGRRPRFLAKQELFESKVMGPMLRNIKQIPVDRAGDRQSALPRAMQLLEEGETIVLFPEGTISTSFVPAEPKHGAARLALASGAPLVPFATWGGQRLGNRDHQPQRADHVALLARFGPAVPVTEGEPVEDVTARLWDAVRELVDEAQRSYPQEPSGDDDRWWVPRHLGGTAPSVEEAAAERARKAADRARRAEERAARDRARARLREAEAEAESRRQR
jgi:1-acyl-sn-glycerol-3-phosphate acyltransferase